MNDVTQKPASSNPYHNWVIAETRHLDLVASWEELCDIYSRLSFLDEINDSMRMTEFKWIIKEMNKQLTRIKSKLMSAKNIEAAIDYLVTQFDSGDIKDRQSLAYAKLKQVWIMKAISDLTVMQEQYEEIEGIEDES